MSKLSTPRRRKTAPVPILVIEDNADQWLIIRACLTQSFPEVAPVWMNNTAQAIAYLETHAVDPVKFPRLVLADLYLPRREDGITILEFIKNHTFYRKPPVIVLSVSPSDEDIAIAYSFSAASYIVKPGNYHDWLNCFYSFRRYWWEIVKLPLRAQ
ncbi:response regulator [Spirosoma sp. HMF4905]|uniref:Response regulator n=1 Tax=Spirosoma arboris TaxID=2682092 RepID=A0A7K1S9J1_9BACT|nr:response regulator [Spirosoma arboris]MVM30431.1 response regulator [Spirosoma arboris]